SWYAGSHEPPSEEQLTSEVEDHELFQTHGLLPSAFTVEEVIPALYASKLPSDEGFKGLLKRVLEDGVKDKLKGGWSGQHGYQFTDGGKAVWAKEQARIDFLAGGAQHEAGPKLWTKKQLLEAPLPAVEWLVPGLLKAGVATVVCANMKECKTQLSLE